jgi:Mrp family chromosome partitioning ATPase
MAILEAEGETKSPAYQDLQTKDQQLVTAEALQTGNASLLRPADGAGKVQSSALRNGLLGLLVGIVLGVGLAFLRDHLDTRVRNAGEVSQRLGLPLLARLPGPPRNLRRGNNLVMVEEPTSHAAEPFRVLLTNLEFVSHEVNPRTIMVTSAREGEGKSTTAANLAVTLARTGKRVALVDLDLRRPFLHEFFHIPPEPGLTTMAVGRATLEDALVPVALAPLPAALRRPDADEDGGGPALHVLCAGAIPPNPGEFIRSRGVGRLIEHLSENYDNVVIDAAPLLGLGDSLVLIPRVDAVLLVARLELLRRPMLDELHRVLENTSATALGIIVTAAEREHSAYGYGYRYSDYAYGYSDERNGRPGVEDEVKQGSERR